MGDPILVLAHALMPLALLRGGLCLYEYVSQQ